MIPGLSLHTDFLGEWDARSLLGWIDAQPWMSNLARRVQHYGWRYDYRARTIDVGAKLGPLPAPLNLLAGRIMAERHMSAVPDQVIINEYLPGQGIAAHIDCEPCFGPEIATLSLCATYPMEFIEVGTLVQQTIWLPVGSLCVLSGDCRYRWKHAIMKRRFDPLPGGGRVPRKRRVSVTFRKVLPGP